MKKYFVVIFLLISACFSFIVFEYQSLLTQKLEIESQSTLFEVKRGATLNSVCRQWQRNHWVDDCQKLRIYSRFEPSITDIKSGVYQLKSVNLLDAVNDLVLGHTHQFSITFVEGMTFKQMLNAMTDAPFLKKHDLTTIKKALFAQGISQDNPEGWFFPETYFYQAGDSDIALLSRAYQKMSAALEYAWQQKQANLPLNSPYEALILASIIEKESGHGAERPMISSVFINRLNKGMRLQTDPTVIYGLGDAYQGDITRAHLRQKTAYNTYRINGLPPTPIAIPSNDAIKAAVNPVSSNNFYFVADGEGQHVFSQTLQQHNRAVKAYLRKIKNES